jgi:hypothetical protein
MTAVVAFEISWKHGAYRVSRPNYLTEGERRKVIELEPVLNLVKALADALECSEDVQDALHDAADAAILDEADALLEAHGRSR